MNTPRILTLKLEEVINDNVFCIEKQIPMETIIRYNDYDSLLVDEVLYLNLKMDKEITKE